MKNVLILLSMVLFAPQVTEKDPLTVLQEARKKMESMQYIKYRQQALYPNPAGLVDTMNAVIELKKKTSSTAFGYDFKFSEANRDEIKLRDDLRITDHSAKKVLFIKDQKELITHVTGHRYVIFSPVTLVKEDWRYTGKNNSHFNFSFTETDTVVDGNTIRTEYHIFLNKKNKLIQRFERRNYFKGNLSQTVIYKYFDYELNDKGVVQSLELSPEYVSEPLKKSTSRTLLEKGAPAVEFKAEDLYGTLLDLSGYRGKKVLLVFSTINCAYSQLALEFLKSETFEQDKNVSIIFIKPEDSSKELRQFTQTIPIPFPVIPNSEKIGEKYGVSAYPTFFLLNEDHIIQEVRLGFDRAFLNGLNEE